jgi:hypothetical protein
MSELTGTPYEVCRLRRHIRALEAKVDQLMLEYCPDEMTEEQKVNWAKHQEQSDE